MSKEELRPAEPRYILSDSAKLWPQRLPVEASSSDEAMSIVMETMIGEDTNLTVERLLEDEEIQAYRDDYTALMEHDKIECEARLAELAGEELSIKERIKRERDTLSSIMQRINDNVRTINEGTTSEDLPRDRSLRLAVDGHYLYYTWVDAGYFTLARVGSINACDDTMFARQTKNQEWFLRTFGVGFSPMGHYEQMPVDASTVETLVGRRLAAGVINASGDEIMPRDTVLDADGLQRLIAVRVDSVVLYTESDAAADI